MLAALALAPALLILATFAAYVFAGVRAGAEPSTGVVAGLGVRGPVTVMRDGRGIPHVRAQNEYDLFFTEGYLQGTDRLFQLDLYRRLVDGRLSEILGNLAVDSDVASRVFDIDGITRAQLAALPARERSGLDAFAAGVNAAMRTRPLAPEFRVLGYRPAPWTAQDSLVASFGTVLALTDGWNDVATRAEVTAAAGPHGADAFFSITDPKYDAPTVPRTRAPVAPLPTLSIPYPNASPLALTLADARSGAGSNNVAAGSALTATHRALLESDPHLQLRIPGVWWLVDLAAPGFHAAGATLAGVPGVILGHNAHLAWGATNGTVTTVRVYRERFKPPPSDEYLADGVWLHAEHRREVFPIRFARPMVRDFLRTRHGFIFEDRGTLKLAAAWTADLDRRSSFEYFDALDRATSVAAGLGALASYPGPPQNFVLADDSGNAGYVLAGDIPLDTAWGLKLHDGEHTGVPARRDVPFAQLPHIAASRSALAFTANDRVYGSGYPYRLTAAFSPPYRAARIAEHLAKHPYDVAAFAAIQSDALSLPERELAAAAVRAVETTHAQDDPQLRAAYAALRRFDGRFVGTSRGAVYAAALRRAATERLARTHLPPALAARYIAGEPGAAFVAVMRMLRERPRGWVANDDYDGFLVAALRDTTADLTRRGQTEALWSDVGARTAEHPLAGLGLGMWNGVRFPGFGDAYSPHVQAPGNAQSFRAVWDVGNWEAGGMVLPLGESGEPGSRHYRDLAPDWIRMTLVPLPFDDPAVAKAATETLRLTP
ncbi:MAG: penicillin acylase family protein [Candidatus Eremiobacteraeota bacterium]|nr:penicillin acylase family protein [Candidatus Eremiobacteraeota bacterium]